MKKTSPLYVMLFIIIISAVCGVAISVVHYLTLDTLESNARLARSRTIVNAFDLTVSEQTSSAYDTALSNHIVASNLLAGQRHWEVFVSKDAPYPVGFIFRGMGFWDAITGIMVLSADLQTILKVDIIEQKETPGLGARIEEPAFKEQMRGFPIDWHGPTGKRVVFGEAGNRDGKHQINAITGASQTSMALERMINSELQAFKTIYEKNGLSTQQSSGGK